MEVKKSEPNQPNQSEPTSDKTPDNKQGGYIFPFLLSASYLSISMPPYLPIFVPISVPIYAVCLLVYVAVYRHNDHYADV